MGGEILATKKAAAARLCVHNGNECQFFSLSLQQVRFFNSRSPLLKLGFCHRASSLSPPFFSPIHFVLVGGTLLPSLEATTHTQYWALAGAHWRTPDNGWVVFLPSLFEQGEDGAGKLAGEVLTGD